MPSTGSGRSVQLLVIALTFALILPLTPWSGERAIAQDGTGGPEIGPEFFAPPVCVPADTNGLVLYQTMNNSGTAPERSLVVAGANGRTIRTIKLSGVPIRVMVTPAPNTAIVITENSNQVANRIEVVDASRGFRYRLTIPLADVQGLMYPTSATERSAGTRYIVLTNALQSSAYLVDLIDGVATDLMAIAGENADQNDLHLLEAIVAPDDRSLIMRTERGVVLISTIRSGDVHSLGSDAEIQAVSYAEGGASVLFTRVQTTGAAEIVQIATDTLTERTLADGTGLIAAQPLPNGTTALLIAKRQLSVIDLVYHVQGVIREFSGDPGQLFIAPDGKAIVYQELDGDQEYWQWLDLRTGESRLLDGLAGLDPVTRTGFPRWLLFAPPDAISSSGSGGQVYRSLDVATGTVLPLFTTDAGTSYLPPVVSPGSGRFALLPWMIGSLGNVLAIDAFTGLVQPLFDGTAVSAVLSPDGCNAALTRQIGAKSARKTQIVLVRLDHSEEIVKSAAGINPVWLTGS